MDAGHRGVAEIGGCGFVQNRVRSRRGVAARRRDRPLLPCVGFPMKRTVIKAAYAGFARCGHHRNAAHLQVFTFGDSQ